MSIAARIFRRGGSLTGTPPSPIAIAGSAPPVLAIHGYGGTPLEIELVRDVARDLGLAARGPLLPGHGTHAGDLARTGWADWVAHADAVLDELTSDGSRAIVVGLSLGSLVAAHLAAARPEAVRGLAMLANAVRLHSPFPTKALELVDRLSLPDFWMPKVGADIGDPEARRTHVTYDTQPVHAAIEVLRAGERVRGELARVRCPTLVVHGRLDRVCPVDNAEEAARLVGTDDVEVVVLPESHHILTRDRERGRVREVLRAFFERARRTRLPVVGPA